jgi:hypothetical protein
MAFAIANFKTFQFGQAQGGSKISTAGILGVFRGFKFSTNAEIGRDKRRLRMERFETGSP